MNDSQDHLTSEPEMPKIDWAIQTILDEYNDTVDTNNQLVDTVESQKEILDKQNTALRLQTSNEKNLIERHDKDTVQIRQLASKVTILQKENKVVNELRATGKKLKAQVERTKESNLELTRKNTRLEGKVRELEQKLLEQEKKNIELGRKIHKERGNAAHKIYHVGTEIVYISPAKTDVDGEEQRTLLLKSGETGILREVGLVINGDINLAIGSFSPDTPNVDMLNAHLPEPSDAVTEFMLTTLLEMKKNDWSFSVV